MQEIAKKLDERLLSEFLSRAQTDADFAEFWLWPGPHLFDAGWQQERQDFGDDER